ncbi:MAG: tetratricopeptide repeat protein [Bacteroidota bacterium]
MKYSCSILLIIIVAGFVSPATAQVPELITNPDFKEDAVTAVDSVYNFNFESAEDQLSEWKEQHPDHPLWSLFEGMQLWWVVLSDLSDDSRDQEFFDVMKKTDHQAGRLLHQHSGHLDGLLIRAISNGYMARHHANREEWVTSINYGRKAIQAYNYLLEKAPELNDLKLAEGLKLYYLDYIPDEYPAVKTVSWAMPDGDKQKGLKAINEASEEAIFARAEAIYFLGNINYNYEKEFDKAVRHFETLYQQYPRNNYYVRILIKSYFRQRKFDVALRVIDESVQRWEQKALPHKGVLKEELWTWKGRILQKNGSNREALTYFKKSVEQSEELGNAQDRPFYVVSTYWAGKLLFDERKTEEAQAYLERATKSNVKNQYREQAQKLLDRLNS